MSEVIIKIPMRTPSLNEMLREHWAERAKEKKTWQQWMMKTRKIGFARVVQITSIRRKKLDFDNFVGGCKEVILDNLKATGWIEDDGPDDILGAYTQVVGHPDKTEIVLSKFDKGEI